MFCSIITILYKYTENTMKLIKSLHKYVAGGCIALSLAAGGVAANAETMTVGATSTGIPFTFLDIKTNSIQGMMIDTAHAIAKAAGFEAKIEQTVFSALIPSLNGNKIDIISAAMLKTAPREEIVDFTDPVYSYGDGLLVKEEDSKDYKSLDDLKGEVVGAQVGTVFVDLLMSKGYFKEVRSYDSLVDMSRDLSLGRIKAGIGDQPILSYQIQQGTLKGVRLADNYTPESMGDVCLVIRKGDKDLMDKLNKAIADIKSDGTLDEIVSKWGI